MLSDLSPTMVQTRPNEFLFERSYLWCYILNDGNCLFGNKVFKGAVVKVYSRTTLKNNFGDDEGKEIFINSIFDMISHRSFNNLIFTMPNFHVKTHPSDSNLIPFVRLVERNFKHGYL